MVSYLSLSVALLSATASAASIRRQTLPCGANGTVSYTIVSGDTLGSIADRLSSGICDIAAINEIPNLNSLSLGTVITVPTGCSTPDNESCLPPVTTATDTCVLGVGSSYNVRSGDSLTAIAADFNITLDGLIAANPAIENPDLILVGQLLNVTVCPDSSCDWVGTRTIEEGDIFFDIAAEAGSTVGQLKSLNANVDPLTIQIGSQVVVPRNCKNNTAPAAPPANGTTYRFA
ncbi:hypothetical protein NX059_008166 [Plenodomus lindquistii]|nr:hypothetical protein NX059_008166 [Plenodomus lindquistii]